MNPLLLLAVSLLPLIQGQDILGAIMPSAPLILDKCLTCCGPPPCCSTCDKVCPVIVCFPCENGYEVDEYRCQTCNCKREECPHPKCIPPPPLSCTEPDFRIVHGVKCPWCPKIVPCKANCDAGMPLPNINCGIRPDRQNCPEGFFCNVDPIDPRNAACCPGCTTGKPLPNVRCDDMKHKCPSGYRCKKMHGICCPDECSPVATDSACYMYTRDCQDDSSCSYGQKCCRQGCSYVCVNPF